MRKSCAMCLMPFKKDPGKRESDTYCSHCFKNGELLYKGKNVKEFKKICQQAMINKGMNKYTAQFYTFFIPLAPYWRKK